MQRTDSRKHPYRITLRLTLFYSGRIVIIRDTDVSEKDFSGGSVSFFVPAVFLNQQMIQKYRKNSLHGG